MKEQKLILAIDQGGQSTRIALFDNTGEQLHCFSATCATSRRADVHTDREFIEQDPADILGGIESCLAKIKNVMGNDLTRITAAGFAGQGSSLLCWDNITGAALTPILSWQDTRGETYLQQFPLSNQQLQSITGLRASPHYGASKIRWCLDHNPQVIAAHKNHRLGVGPIASYIFQYFLRQSSDDNPASGERLVLVDPGHAQRTLLWSIRDNNWDSALLAHFSIPRNILPACQYHNSHFGYLPLADHLIPLTASARDQGASLFAQGLPDKNACYINIGTGAFIQRVSERLQAPDGLLVSPLWIPEHKYDAAIRLPQNRRLYAWEATVNGAASATGFIQEQTGLQITPESLHHALQLNPDRHCYFLNAIGGLSAPYWRTDVQSRFSDGLGPYEKMLAWLESIVFQIVVNVTLMNALNVAEHIYISGGLSNADALCQKIADLAQVPVHRSENADATLQGIAYLAAAMPEGWCDINTKTVFFPEENTLLHCRYLIWKAALDNWLQ